MLGGDVLAIWSSARNKFYFEKFQAHPRSILDGALGFLDEYQSSEARGCIPKLLILFVTFVCLGFTCTMFPPCFFFFFWQFLPAAIAIVFPLFGFMLRVFTSYTFSYQYNFCLLPKKKKLGESIIVYFFIKKKKKGGLKITIYKTNIHKLTLQGVSKIAHNLID